MLVIGLCSTMKKWVGTANAANSFTSFKLEMI